jgi:hypothetical protein
MRAILRDLLELNQVEKAAYGTDARVGPHRDDGRAVPNTISYAIWWLDGIPRFLEHFITCVAEKWHISSQTLQGDWKLFAMNYLTRKWTTGSA